MKPQLLVITSILVLSGCGGGSSPSDVPVVTTSTPMPTATPIPPATLTPRPTPTPTPMARAITFDTPSAAALIDENGVAQVLAAVNSSSANTLSVTDPDAPLAASFQDLVLSGNEAFSVTRTDGTSSYAAAFSSAASAGATTFDFYASGEMTPRPLTVLKWQTGTTAGEPPALNVIQSQATDKHTQVLVPSNLPVHARLIETVAADRRALQLIGTPAAISSLPGQNGLQYSGEVYGTVFTADKTQLQFIGDATIFVDAGNSDSQIHGIIYVSQYLGKSNAGIQIQINVVADIANGAIKTKSIRVIGAGGMVSFGAISGGFYGPAANELGLLFSARGEPGSLIAGAHRQAKVARFTAGCRRISGATL